MLCQHQSICFCCCISTEINLLVSILARSTESVIEELHLSLISGNPDRRVLEDILLHVQALYKMQTGFCSIKIIFYINIWIQEIFTIG